MDTSKVKALKFKLKAPAIKTEEQYLDNASEQSIKSTQTPSRKKLTLKKPPPMNKSDEDQSSFRTVCGTGRLSLKLPPKNYELYSNASNEASFERPTVKSNVEFQRMYLKKKNNQINLKKSSLNQIFQEWIIMIIILILELEQNQDY